MPSNPNTTRKRRRRKLAEEPGVPRFCPLDADGRDLRWYFAQGERKDTKWLSRSDAERWTKVHRRLAGRGYFLQVYYSSDALPVGHAEKADSPLLAVAAQYCISFSDRRSDELADDELLELGLGLVQVDYRAYRVRADALRDRSVEPEPGCVVGRSALVAFIDPGSAHSTAKWAVPAPDAHVRKLMLHGVLDLATWGGLWVNDRALDFIMSGCLPDSFGLGLSLRDPIESTIKKISARDQTTESRFLEFQSRVVKAHENAIWSERERVRLEREIAREDDEPNEDDWRQMREQLGSLNSKKRDPRYIGDPGLLYLQEDGRQSGHTFVMDGAAMEESDAGTAGDGTFTATELAAAFGAEISDASRVLNEEGAPKIRRGRRPLHWLGTEAGQRARKRLEQLTKDRLMRALIRN